MKRVKYLNNRDLLAQIHASKNTYCSYVDKEDSQYDLIVPSLKKINASAIAQARKAKAKRMTQEAWEEAKAAGLKKIKPSKVKELYMRGETLPYSSGIAGMQARVGGKKMFGPGIQGRDVTRNRATASTYAQGAMDSGVPIIRSKKITPTFREIATDDPLSLIHI